MSIPRRRRACSRIRPSLSRAVRPAAVRMIRARDSRRRREPLAGPRRDRFRLVERDVLDRFGRRLGFAAPEAPPHPAYAAPLPIERRFDTFLPKPLPAVVGPVTPFQVAAVLDELREALVRDGVALDRECRQLDNVL